MANLSDKNKLLHNFSRCSNWEEKYLYIIDLGGHLPPLPKDMRTPDYLVSGCQSQVWIVMTADSNGDVQLYGDSDATIVKGLIAIVFILYQDLTLEEIGTINVRPFFDALSLTQHLTPSRSKGLEAMVQSIRAQAAALLRPDYFFFTDCQRQVQVTACPSDGSCKQDRNTVIPDHKSSQHAC